MFNLLGSLIRFTISRRAAVLLFGLSSLLLIVLLNELISLSLLPKSILVKPLFFVFSIKSETAIICQVSSLSVSEIRFFNNALNSFSDASVHAKVNRLLISWLNEFPLDWVNILFKIPTECPFADEAIAICKSGSPEQSLANSASKLPAVRDFHSPRENAS